MSETVKKQSVRITLLHSGFHPPLFILASFTNPPWEPQEMKHAGMKTIDSGVDSQDPTFAQVDYMFWRRFDIYPGVWNYKYRVGHNDWLIYDHNAETETSITGEKYNVLRIEDKGPKIFQSPAALPIFGSETSSSRGSRRASSSDLGSSHGIKEDPLAPLNLRQPRGSCSSFVTNLFPSSPASVAAERSDNPRVDEENVDRAAGSASSVESEDHNGFFVLCWKSFVAWIYVLFAKVRGRSSRG